MAASRPAASPFVRSPRLDRDWPGTTMIVRLERRREFKTYCSRQIVYAFTSIPPETMNAEALLALARAHWQIENRLFRVRDGTFAEDACRVRSGSAPAALAHLRDACLTLIRKRNEKPKPAAKHSPQTQRPLSAPSSQHELNGPGIPPSTLGAVFGGSLGAYGRSID